MQKKKFKVLNEVHWKIRRFIQHMGVPFSKPITKGNKLLSVGVCVFKLYYSSAQWEKREEGKD